MYPKRALGRFFDRVVAWRVDERFDRQNHDLQQLRQDVRPMPDLLAEVEDLERRLVAAEEAVRGLREQVDRTTGTAEWSANELARLAPQAAAFEQRLERAARPVVLTGELTDLPEARELVVAVREEHARVRARLALVSAYEERLRRLEATLQRGPR